jgi:hypothetical protein
MEEELEQRLDRFNALDTGRVFNRDSADFAD